MELAVDRTGKIIKEASIYYITPHIAMSTFEQLMIDYWKYKTYEEFEVFYRDHADENCEIEYGPGLTMDKQLFLECLHNIYRSFPGNIFCFS